jgi:segregation and condensation protein B
MAQNKAHTTLMPMLERNAELKRLEKQERQTAKKIIEALLFSVSEPLSFLKLREIIELKLPIKPKTLRDALNELQEEYIAHERAFRLEEVSSGFILKTCEEYAPFIEQLFRNRRLEKLSQASLEVLAIIAYKQPITKPQVDAIRGVDCSGIMQNLQDRELIEPIGKLEAQGRAMLYGTTPKFLLHFGIKNVADLPHIKS